MLKLKDKYTTPPGGWRYTQRESGKLISSPSFPSLVVAVRQHRMANGYPLQMDMEQEVEEGACKESPGHCDDMPPDLIPSKLTLSNVFAFTMTLGESLLKGNPRVDDEEADRRAAVCAGCSDNVPIGGCGGCNAKTINSAIEKLTRAKPTKLDDKLHTCRYCGCLNKAQIWFPLDILQNHINPKIREALPAHCWKK
jgi:hypothetical protein